MPFNQPSDAIHRVLKKIGVDPTERLSATCQDPEYTASRREEIDVYFDLYLHGDVDRLEREVLGCFLLQEFNDLCGEDTPHPLQARVFETLFGAGDLHAEELGYWMNTHDDPDPENWWPIAAHLLQYSNHVYREGRTAG